MKITYDPEVDVLRAVFSNMPIEESDEEKPGMILDYDKNGNIVGIGVIRQAAHLAMASVHNIDYLVTWNCVHIAN